MRRSVLFASLCGVALIAAAVYFLVPGTSEAIARLTPGGAATSDDAARAAGGHQAVQVVAAESWRADFPIREHAIGFIQSPNVVNISARVTSQIIGQHVQDGQMVASGDLLFTLDDRALKAQVASAEAALARDQATLVSAIANATRAQDLVRKQAGTQQAADEAVAAQNAAKASIDADKAAIETAQIQLGYANVTAPISGRLGAVQVTPGNLVNAGGSSSATSTLVTITQMDPLDVAFSLPESELPLLRAALGASTPAAVRLFGKADPATPLATGTLDFIDSTVDQASGTIAVRASIANADLKLWPGQYVDVEIQAGMLPGVTAVPSVAVQMGQQGTFVYVVKPDSTIEARGVTVALADGDTTALSAGLEPGEQVVTDGQMRLKAGMTVKASAAADTPAPASATAEPRTIPADAVPAGASGATKS